MAFSMMLLTSAPAGVIALYKVPTPQLLDDKNVELIIRRHNARILEITREYVVLEKTGHSDETEALFEEPLHFDGQSREHPCFAVGEQPGVPYSEVVGVIGRGLDYASVSRPWATQPTTKAATGSDTATAISTDVIVVYIHNR